MHSIQFCEKPPARYVLRPRRKAEEAPRVVAGRIVADPRGLEELVRAGGIEALLFFLESNREDLPVRERRQGDSRLDSPSSILR